jgi:hypothetical protein
MKLFFVIACDQDDVLVHFGEVSATDMAFLPGLSWFLQFKG